MKKHQGVFEFMTKVKTIILWDKESQKTIHVEIFTAENLDHGYWNIDTNQVLLTSELYKQFESCKKQSEQKSFFNQLHKFSNTQIKF